MKILLINNNTVHLKDLVKSLSGHEVEIRNYRPGLDFGHDDKDLILLSGGGGEGQEIYDEHKPGERWYADEMHFVRECRKPIVGVCMGFEVIANAYGAPVTKVGGLIGGKHPVALTASGKAKFNRGRAWQFEFHRWRVEDLPVGFQPLATSKYGLEAFEYREGEKYIFATQFHPEKGGSLELKSLIPRLEVL